MYSTCIFCHGALGTNEVVEHFPIGRRLAYDEAKGRLWVVCRKCERWNLTPLEERWEAIEECERAFEKTKLRASTDQIALARLKEGTELVRIGSPLRPEMAAWRYGDQFGRRRKKMHRSVLAAVVTGGVLLVAPQYGLLSGGAFSLVLNSYSVLSTVYRSKRLLPASLTSDTAAITQSGARDVSLRMKGSDIVLDVPVLRDKPARQPLKLDLDTTRVELRGDDAIRMARVVLPYLNQNGGTAGQVTRAVSTLEDTADPAALLRRAAQAIAKREKQGVFWIHDPQQRLSLLPIAERLALEMAVHEDAERRAMEGELLALAAEWQSAEEIARIADDMFLPVAVMERLERLKGRK